jgi:predicted glutamine amidotransferase
MNCFNRNSDGAGLMYVNKGKVVIRKGFMDFNSFYDYIEKLDNTFDLTEKALVMHFRISTGGNVDGGNCHPYPITNNADRLRKTMVSTTLGMAHNGIISDYSHKDKVLNDTQMFVKNCVSVLYDYDKEFYYNPKVMSMLKDIAGSKLCFLDANEEIHYVGDFVEENGVLYSNTTYKTYVSYPNYSSYYTKGSKYPSYSKYDDYDYASYGYSSYYGYEDFHDYEDDYEKYDTIVIDKLIEGGAKEGEPLTSKEFEFCLGFMDYLDKGTVVNHTEGKFIVPNSENYGIDNWFNVYYIDYEKEDIYLIFENVLLDITKEEALGSE